MEINKELSKNILKENGENILNGEKIDDNYFGEKLQIDEDINEENNEENDDDNDDINNIDADDVDDMLP